MLSLCLTNWALRHEHVWGSGGIAPPLTSTLDGSEWSASCSRRFTSGKRATGTHWIGDWVGPKNGLDNVERRKILPQNLYFYFYSNYSNVNIVEILQ
jgi:hypothetical protein